MLHARELEMKESQLTLEVNHNQKPTKMEFFLFLLELFNF